MKLGEALSVRAKQAQKLNDLRGRIKGNASVQDGEAPAEDPQALVTEFIALSAEHAILVSQIAKTNAATMVDGATLTQMLAMREDLIRQRNLYGIAADAATGSQTSRYMRSELAQKPTIDVADFRRIEDEMSERVHKLDAQIQAANWQTDLV